MYLAFKRYYTSLLPLLLCISLLVCCSVSCQNDGYIGNLFGTWGFDSISVNGEPLEDYEEGMMISFQGDMLKFDNAYTHYSTFGIWEKTDKILKLTIKESYNIGGFPPQFSNEKFGTMTLTIVSDSSRKMVWERIADDGAVWRYTLRKLL